MLGMRRICVIGVTVVVLCAGCVGWLVTGGDAQTKPAGEGADAVAAGEAGETPGRLQAFGKEGKDLGLCPLKHTDVKTDISGFVARVEVTQQFHNPFDERIEAVYTFPLSQRAAVDDMLMKVGERTIRGQIKERGEARRIYEAAKQAGHVASLLDQERPNIFTQSVANIMPGENVDVTIRYVEVLKFEDSWYEFSFPTVVGPRYIPGAATSKVPDTAPENEGRVVEVAGPKKGPDPKGTGWAPDTDQVPDASRITPPVTAPGTRAGHDISISVSIDAGAKLRDVKSVLHDVTKQHTGSGAQVTLKQKATIPNKDFVLRYTTAVDDIGDAVLTHASDKGRFFTLVLQPPKRVRPEKITAKEMVFVLDTSGSMRGDPIEKAKATMMYCLDNLNPKDTFNFITFSGSTHVTFPKPVPATPENIGKVQEVLAAQKGRGGTEMMKAIKVALDPSDAQEHLRIVCFMTDGYVGNDMAIVDEIQRHANARVFSFGIGNSVNRFLLDKMASAGRGEADYVLLNAEEKQVAERFYERLRYPVLTDIELDWGSLPVTQVYPERIPDLFSAKPVVVHGQGIRQASGQVTLRGKVAGKPFERTVDLRIPARQPEHEVLGPLWARAKIEHLMNQDWKGMQGGRPRVEIKQAIIDLGLEFRLVTQYTSFVAVEEMTVTEGDTTRTIAVPVEMPDGVSYEGVFGTGLKRAMSVRGRPAMAMGRGMGMGMAVPAAPAGPRGGRAPAASLAPRERPVGEPVDSATSLEAIKARPDSRVRLDDKWVQVKDMTPAQKRRYILQQKLAKELQGLAERVAKEGTDGNLKLEGVEVKDGVVELRIWLTDDSAESIGKLKALGVKVIVQAKAVKMLVGKLPVTKLEEVALLECVRYIEPSA